MKKLLIISSLAFAASSAFAQTSNVTSSCSNNQFELTANFGAAASCSYDEKLNVNGIETFEQIDFSGNLVRTIPLQEGDVANVTGVFRCSTTNGSFSATRTDQTINGCNGVSQVGPTPDPEPTPIPEPPIDEFDPAALQEFQLELSNLLVLASSEVDNLRARADRFAVRNPGFAARILSSGITRLQTLTDIRLNRLVNDFADSIEPTELLSALEQFAQDFDSIIDIQ
ncbi:hypothetical protein [Glaciecola sp. SC05]|uniref:hypothetical protein n=1 Tax=Glaciecola sp. SC05 TaxID=1987355 RepID=UPI0035272DE7